MTAAEHASLRAGALRGVLLEIAQEVTRESSWFLVDELVREALLRDDGMMAAERAEREANASSGKLGLGVSP